MLQTRPVRSCLNTFPKMNLDSSELSKMKGYHTHGSVDSSELSGQLTIGQTYSGFLNLVPMNEENSELLPRRNRYQTKGGDKKAPVMRRFLFLFLAAAILIGITILVKISRDGSYSSPSSSSADSSKKNDLTDSIDGGFWTAVRCVSSKEGAWHPATDNLRGTESYGTVSSWEDDTTWSASWSFDNDGFTQVLLALTDFSYWLVVDSSTLFQYGAPLEATILASSASSNQTFAQWYIREGNTEDPWASVYDHSASDPGMVYGENSKKGHMEHLGKNGIGACVWLR